MKLPGLYLQRQPARNPLGSPDAHPACASERQWLVIDGPAGAWDQASASAVTLALFIAQLPLILEVLVGFEQVRLAINCLASDSLLVTRAVRGATSSWGIGPAEPPVPPSGKHRQVYLLEHQTGEPDMPLAAIGQTGKADPLAALLEATQPLSDDEQVLIRFAIRPANITEQEQAAERLYRRVMPLTLPEITATAFGNPPMLPRFEHRLQQHLEERLRGPIFAFTGVVALTGHAPADLTMRGRSLQMAFGNHFQLKLRRACGEEVTGVICRPLLVTTSELATLWHVPGADVVIPGIQHRLRPQTIVPSPLQNPGDGAILLGTHYQRGQEVSAHLARADLQAGHAAIVGRTGTGKSTLTHQILRQIMAMRDRPGVALIDPHGRLASSLIGQSLPPDRLDDVIFVDLSDVEYPVGLPLFWSPPNLSRDVVVENTFSLIRLLFQESWSSTRMADLVYAVTATLCRFPGATLFDAPQLLTEPGFRRSVLRHLDDPVALDFWQEFEGLSDSARRETIRPALHRLRSLYRSPAVRNIVCQPQGLNFLDVIDRGQILVVSLAGEEASAETDMLGELVIARLHLAAMARLARPEGEQRPLFLAIDESQRFQGASLPILLSEARKASLTLLLITQYISGWDEKLAASVLGNVGTLIAFRAAAQDSRRLSASLTPFSPEELENLDRYEAIVKLQFGGKTLPAFDVITPKLPDQSSEERLAYVRERTRSLYATSRADVEQQLSGHFASRNPNLGFTSGPWNPREEIDEA
jgi:hypothetical protein